MWRVPVTLLLLLFLAACHEDAVFHWITPEAPAPEAIAPEVVPDEEVGVDEPEPMPEPPCLLIKGNISRDGRKLYHMEGMPNYNQVKIDEDAGEMFFCSEEEALEAGWSKAGG